MPRHLGRLYLRRPHRAEALALFEEDSTFSNATLRRYWEHTPAIRPRGFENDIISSAGCTHFVPAMRLSRPLDDHLFITKGISKKSRVEVLTVNLEYPSQGLMFGPVWVQMQECLDGAACLVSSRRWIGSMQDKGTLVPVLTA